MIMVISISPFLNTPSKKQASKHYDFNLHIDWGILFHMVSSDVLFLKKNLLIAPLANSCEQLILCQLSIFRTQCRSGPLNTYISGCLGSITYSHDKHLRNYTQHAIDSIYVCLIQWFTHMSCLTKCPSQYHVHLERRLPQTMNAFTYADCANSGQVQLLSGSLVSSSAIAYTAVFTTRLVPIWTH